MSPGRLRTRLLAIGLTAAVFGGGIATGVALDRLWLRPELSHAHKRRGPPEPQVLLERFRKDLDLTDEQADKILVILEQARERSKSLFDDMRAVRETTRGEIRAILDDGQRAKYDARIERRKKRRDSRK